MSILNDFFATKIGMTQAWTKEGKRLAITRCSVNANIVIGAQSVMVLDNKSQVRKTQSATILEIGSGRKKLKNMTKPLRSKLEKGGFSFGVTNLKGLRVVESDLPTPKAGESIVVDQILTVGDVVQVQGVSKGRGFSGGVKRHGFHGGPRTHGQSDRERAVGSIGAGTTPGRVYVGKRMPGKYGNDTKTISGLIVVHINTETGELWLNGPVPGSMNAQIKITKTGKAKKVVLDQDASGIKVSDPVIEPTPEVITEVEPEVVVENTASDETAEVAAKAE
jgi:large subunit ribosomal protein L3